MNRVLPSSWCKAPQPLMLPGRALQRISSPCQARPATPQPHAPPSWPAAAETNAAAGKPMSRSLLAAQSGGARAQSGDAELAALADGDAATCVRLQRGSDGSGEVLAQASRCAPLGSATRPGQQPGREVHPTTPARGTARAVPSHQTPLLAPTDPLPPHALTHPHPPRLPAAASAVLDLGYAATVGLVAAAAGDGVPAGGAVQFLVHPEPGGTRGHAAGPASPGEPVQLVPAGWAAQARNQTGR